MTVHLLDVNVLVALAWPNHVHHAAARTWFVEAHAEGWATTPITESGFIRVSSNRRVIADARSPREAAGLVRQLRGVEGHRFWPDDVSLATSPEVDFDRVQGYRQVTDVHLLTVASRMDGAVATFDAALESHGIAPVTSLSLWA